MFARTRCRHRLAGAVQRLQHEVEFSVTAEGRLGHGDAAGAVRFLRPTTMRGGCDSIWYPAMALLGFRCISDCSRVLLGSVSISRGGGPCLHRKLFWFVTVRSSPSTVVVGDAVHALGADYGRGGVRQRAHDRGRRTSRAGDGRMGIASAGRHEMSPVRPAIGQARLGQRVDVEGRGRPIQPSEHRVDGSGIPGPASLLRGPAAVGRAVDALGDGHHPWLDVDVRRNSARCPSHWSD